MNFNIQDASTQKKPVHLIATFDFLPQFYRPERLFSHQHKRRIYEQWNKLAVIFNIANNVKLNIASRKISRWINDILNFVSLYLFCWVLFKTDSILLHLYSLAFVTYAKCNGWCDNCTERNNFTSNKILETTFTLDVPRMKKLLLDGWHACASIARDIEMSKRMCIHIQMLLCFMCRLCECRLLNQPLCCNIACLLISQMKDASKRLSQCCPIFSEILSKCAQQNTNTIIVF